jgi:tRNA-(ms[2]io[6]A)-hydroxylase
MLGLKLATDPRWANLAEKSLEDILTDHAYCEQKAALNGISLIMQYPEKEQMVDELSSLVAEEWGHFRQVMRELKKRGLKLGHKRKDEYVNELIKLEHTGGTRDNRLMERLLVSAMIEARSCERFRVLSLNMEQEDMRQFYHGFMVSEAGHYRMFIDLAKEYAPEEKVKARWQEILDAEEQIMQGLELRGDRVH